MALAYTSCAAPLRKGKRHAGTRREAERRRRPSTLRSRIFPHYRACADDDDTDMDDALDAGTRRLRTRTITGTQKQAQMDKE